MPFGSHPRRWNMALLAAALIGVVGATLSLAKFTTTSLLEQEAVSTGQAWANYLAKNIPDLTQIADGAYPSAASMQFFEQSQRVGNVFRYKIFHPDGRLRLVILGTGETKIQKRLLDAHRANPEQLGLKIAFDEKIAHAVYAGSDLFLIPSRYEPCGLTQMYSLRYGTVPVVRATGGLDDSIRDYDDALGKGTGFKFEAATPEAMIEAVRKALAAFGRPDVWAHLVRNGMAEDFSWDKAARSYRDLYEKILAL